jgi:hypothetical protein
MTFGPSNSGEIIKDMQSLNSFVLSNILLRLSLFYHLSYELPFSVLLLDQMSLIELLYLGKIAAPVKALTEL